MAHRLSSSYFAPTSSVSKHASTDLAGSVFLISSAGNILRLPIPSSSPRDPLSWSWSKRVLAFTCLQFYSIVASFEANIPGTLMPAFQDEFGAEVCPMVIVSRYVKDAADGGFTGHRITKHRRSAFGNDTFRRPGISPLYPSIYCRWPTPSHHWVCEHHSCRNTVGRVLGRLLSGPRGFGLSGIRSRLCDQHGRSIIPLILLSQYSILKDTLG